MEFELLISKRARKQLANAYAWYDDQLPGLGLRFLESFEHSINLIKRNPFSYSIRRKKVRGKVMRKFPYLILFVVEGNVISIGLVFHMSQKPLK